MSDQGPAQVGIRSKRLMTLKRRTFLVVALTLAGLLAILYAVGEGLVAQEDLSGAERERAC